MALSALLVAATLTSAQQQPSSSEMLEAAKLQVAGTNRAIFVIFHSSW